jgi:hypothetical protein
MSNKIVPWFETRRNRVVYAFVGFEHEVGVGPDVFEPVGIGAVKTILSDFEPDGSAVGLVFVTAWFSNQFSVERNLG